MLVAFPRRHLAPFYYNTHSHCPLWAMFRLPAHIIFCLRAGGQVYIIVALARGDGSHSEACHLNRPPPIRVHREIAATLKSPYLISRSHIIRWRPPQKGHQGGLLHNWEGDQARGFGIMQFFLRCVGFSRYEVRAMAECARTSTNLAALAAVSTRL